mgnify:CR=1 FL=1
MLMASSVAFSPFQSLRSSKPRDVCQQPVFTELCTSVVFTQRFIQYDFVSKRIKVQPFVCFLRDGYFPQCNLILRSGSASTWCTLCSVLALSHIVFPSISATERFSCSAANQSEMYFDNSFGGNVQRYVRICHCRESVGNSRNLLKLDFLPASKSSKSTKSFSTAYDLCRRQ